MASIPNLFRSEPMMYIQMFVSNDAAHDTVHELGSQGLVQFVDLNPKLSAFNRPFTNDIRRCEELERRLRFFKKLIDEESESEGPSPMGLHMFSQIRNQSFHQMEQEIVELEHNLQDVQKHVTDLTAQLNVNREHLVVITRADELFRAYYRSGAGGDRAHVDTRRPLTDGDMEMHPRVGTFTGVVPAKSMETFERVFFRTTRGNGVLKFCNGSDKVMDPATNTLVEKRVFAVFYYSSSLGGKIEKIMNAFGCTLYDFSMNDRYKDETRIHDSVRELLTILDRTTKERRNDIQAVQRSLAHWTKTVTLEKAGFHVLNKFEKDLNRSCMVGEGWCSRANIDGVQAALHRAMSKSGAQVPSVCSEVPPTSTPPTHFRTNKLTSAFQAIVDAYGIANYREMNPMPFTVITFPFLFAVMFGDIGHGALMLLVALYMLWNESHYEANPPGEIGAILFGGRYVVLLMSLFSIYCGFMYNETFALSMDLFGSGYEIGAATDDNGYTTYVQWTGKPYPFGLDPIWKQAENELSFTNSLKMKMSVIFGVAQMMFGILLGGFNHAFFGHGIAFRHEFIPQVIFLSSIFGYMSAVIIIKWGTSYEGQTHCAPSILTAFIEMFLGFGTVSPVDDTCAIYGFFEGQSNLEQVLIILAFISVPWMLLTKPILENIEHQKHARKYKSFTNSLDGDGDGGGGEDAGPGPGAGAVHGEHEEFDFAEEFVHQVIHTIEFVLGCVSNTASYLRLWALSLAHGQLSTVFWEKAVVENLAEDPNPVMVVIGVMVWVCCTLSVLMVMESLSAFLHALRLHWVEFQNKFYKGAGGKFAPLDFGIIERMGPDAAAES